MKTGHNFELDAAVPSACYMVASFQEAFDHFVQYKDVEEHERMRQAVEQSPTRSASRLVVAIMLA